MDRQEDKEDKEDKDSNEDSNEEDMEDKEAKSDTIKYMLINDWAVSQHHAKTSDNKSLPFVNLLTIKLATNDT